MHIHDVVIKNGNIVDGSGKKPFLGDIAIDEGKITKVGEVINSGKKEIDADGKLSVNYRCDAPIGSGLGTTGAINVALMAAINGSENAEELSLIHISEPTRLRRIS